MANSLVTNPIFIDTFSADVTISSTPIRVKAISFWSTAADDKLVLEDVKGVTSVYIQLATAKDTKILSFGDGMIFNGLVLDVSDGTYTSASRLIIYT